MAIIKTLDAVEAENNAANFLSLKHCFLCNETGGTTLYDSVGGVEITVDSITGDGTKVTTTDASNDALAAGEWYDGSLTNVLIMLFGDNYSSLAHIGDGDGRTGTQQAYGTNALAARWDVADGANTFSALPGSVDTGLACVYYSGGGDLFDASLGSISGTYTDPAATTATGATGFQPAASARMALVNVYGILMFSSTALPSDLNQAALWMSREWIVNDNKVIYPAWLNNEL